MTEAICRIRPDIEYCSIALIITGLNPDYRRAIKIFVDRRNDRVLIQINAGGDVGCLIEMNGEVMDEQSCPGESIRINDCIKDKR